ncbi:MAG: FHA domain-containing protein, partial [Thermoanaerobaculia bacterium]
MPGAGASLALMWLDPATGETRRVPLAHALRIGSDRLQNDVALPFAGIGALHAEILARPGGGWEIAAVGALRLKVDGAAVERVELKPGATFSVGIVDFTVGYTGASISSSRIVVPPFPLRPPLAA